MKGRGRIAAYGLAFGLGTTQKMAALIPLDLEDNCRFSVSSCKSHRIFFTHLP